MALPPLPAPNVAPEITPLLTIDKVSALAVTLPAFPVLPRLAWALIPVGKLGFANVPSIVSRPATPTETLPPFPDPKVLLAISPFLLMVKAPALTDTLPAAPVRPGSAFDAMPVKTPVGVPVIDSSPFTRTETLPPFPGPNVLLAIVPLLAIDKVPAVTVRLPASPLAAAKSGFAPSALLEIKPPLMIESPRRDAYIPAVPGGPGVGLC
jgi:hypothetical protein